MEKTSNALKALSETEDELRVGNYIVLFGGRDLEGIANDRVNADGTRGQYFTKSTDFESDFTKSGALFVDWEHGAERKSDPIAPGKSDVLGYVDWKTARVDPLGLWVDRVLDRRNKYMKYLEVLIKNGLIGNSIETVVGMDVKSTGEIIKAPLKRDTLTVIPMEPRMMTINAVTALKSLAEIDPALEALLPQGEGNSPASAATDINIKNIQKVEVTKMADITLSADEYKELIKNQVMASSAAPKADTTDPAVKSLSDKLEALTALIEKSPALKDGGYVAPDSETDHPEVKSLGDFCIAVKNKNEKRIKSVYKTALAEDAGATGGYLVPTPLMAPIIAAAEPFSVLRRAGATIVPMANRSFDIPILDIETAPSAGDTSYAGGVVATWEGEAAALDESEPRFRMEELVCYELSGYSLASNALRADSGTSIDALLSTMFGRASGSKENYAFFRGDGVGKPKGLLGSAALVSATRSAASAIALDDLGEMMSDFLPSSWGKGAWFINPSAVHKLIQLVSSPLSWMSDLRSGMPVSLLGMPVYVTGALPALNTAGDILLVDPSYYLIGDRQSMSIAYSEHYKFVNNQGTWRFVTRVGGMPWINNTITLENASTVVSPYVALAAG